MYKNFVLPNFILSKSVIISSCFTPEGMVVAFMPNLFKFFTWSCIKAINGEITKQVPSFANAGI